MNYLAHIYLSGPDPQHQVGGLLGDFVKGPLRGEYPRKIEEGIRLHRNIDTATDHHPAFRECLVHLPPPWRRFGGILLDVYFDHLLASKWSEYSSENLELYCRNFYLQLTNHYNLLPEGAKRFSLRAPDVKWLENYARSDMIPLMLNNLGKRLKRPLALGEAWPELVRRGYTLETTFHQLMEAHLAQADIFFRDSL